MRASMTMKVALVVISFAAATQSAYGKALCPTHIVVHVDGSVGFDDQRFLNQEKLESRLISFKKSHSDCFMSVTADNGVRFEIVGRVVLTMQKAGFSSVGFLTEPRSSLQH